MERPRLLPELPNTQARGSTTFVPPPLDGSLTAPQIYDWHLQHNPSHRLFVYAQQDGSTREILWGEAVHAIHAGATLLRSRFGWVAGRAEAPIIAILASSDAIPYCILLMSCFRANYIVFPISPRNSPAAVAHLIQKVGVDHLLIGHEPAMLQLAQDSIDILKQASPLDNPPDISYVLRFEELFLPSSDKSAVPDALPYEYKGPDATMCILHSSGSTAFPRPIYISNHRAIQGAIIPWFGQRDLTDKVISIHGMPIYHGMGAMQTWWSASCGLVLSTFEPKSIPSIPTPASLFDGAKATKSDILFSVPSLIEAWSREPEYVKWLATRSGVIYGGGPLNKDIGDYMTSQGVSIFILYGSSEGGIMSTILPAQVEYDWDYFQFPALLTAKMIPHGDNTFELILVSSPFCRPAKVNTQVDGIEAYATSDLLMPHPTKSGYWKVVGRTDDQIMHSTGEKTNPGPLETMLAQDPNVLSSVMFGRGRLQAGILVDPKPALKFDPADSVKLAEFRNLIWPTVMTMNAFAPQHSRLFKEMILVAKPDKPFTYTAKLTVRRQAVIADYEDEINTLYDTVDETSALNIAPLVEWDGGSILIFVRDVIHKIMAHLVGDEEDIFHHGCDSLQATWIRNSLLRSLRESAQLDTRRYTRNFVYEYPTVSRLAEYIAGIASGKVENEGGSIRPKTDAMRDMVAKYVQDFPKHTGVREGPGHNAKTVLVTGTTGELGCYLLSMLLADPNVAQVYALNRPSAQEPDLRKRQAHALTDRGLDANILDLTKISLLEGNILRPQFDLTAAVYEGLQGSVTHIIHAAWPVDFNLALRSFEPNVQGLRKLLDFCLNSPFLEPPMLMYTSSIGVFQNVQTKGPLLELPIEAETAVGNGYGESKWVAEQILAKAAESTQLKPLIVRVGQLCGGINGAWNTKEWFPALVQSGKFLQCIPDDSRDVSWIPVDAAAAAILDFLEAERSTPILHLINPKPTPWSVIAQIIAADIGVPVAPYTDWLGRLQNATLMQDTPKSFRAPRLLRSFESALRQKECEKEAFGLPKLDATEAMRSSELLRSRIGCLGEAEINLWMGYWKRAGLL